MTIDVETTQAILDAMEKHQHRLLVALNPDERKLYITFLNDALDVERRASALESLGASSPAGRGMYLLWKYIARQRNPNFPEDNS